MSITVKLWTDADLESLATDDNLLTVFFNRQGYSEKEIKRLHELNKKRKTYFVYFDTQDDSEFESNDDYEPRKIYAVSDESLRWFLKQEYHYSMLESIIEVVSTTREVSL